MKDIATKIRAAFTSWLGDFDVDEVKTPAQPLALAVLLLDVAWADHALRAVELELISASLSRLYGLDDQQAKATREAALRIHTDAASIQPFTRALCDTLAAEERKALIVELWRLAFADQGLDKYEEQRVRKIADLLYVDHRAFIAAKQAARRDALGE